MRKIILYFGVICLYILILGNSSNAGWLTSSTLEIKGKVIDATTEKPIKNVVVITKWIGDPLFPSLNDQGDDKKTFHHFITVTDEEGNYIIPKKNKLDFGKPARFGREFWRYTVLYFEHPLYTNGGTFLRKSSLLPNKDSRFQSDCKLVSLEDTYVKDAEKLRLAGNEKELKILASRLHNETLLSKTIKYFYFLKKSGVEYDLDYIFSEWERLFNYFPEYLTDRKDYLETIKKYTIKRLKEDKIDSYTSEKD